MSEHGMNKQEARRYLAAFADGELDVEQNLRVIEQMAMDPANTRRVLHQHQLRRATRQAMDRQDDVAPAALRSQIEKIAANEPATPTPHGGKTSARPADTLGPGSVVDEEGNEESESREVTAKDDTATGPGALKPSPSVLAGTGRAQGARIARWIPPAAAACLLIVALAALYSVRNRINHGPAQPAAITDAQYAIFASRHVVCSADVSNLFDTFEFPREVKKLPGGVEDYFNVTSGPVPGHLVDSLDLSVLGYRFVRAGACMAPGVGSVHVVYRAVDQPSANGRPDTAAGGEAGSEQRLIKRTAGGSNQAEAEGSPGIGRGSPKAISLWIKPDDGKFEIEPGRVYKVWGKGDRPPLLIWKRAGRVYFLIGDVPEEAEEAAEFLSGNRAAP